MVDEIEQAARDLVERRDSGAIQWLEERIRELEAQKDIPSLDATYRVLSAVERMLEARISRPASGS